MEKKAKNLLRKAEKIMGEDADILILSQKDGKCAGISHGDTEEIAEALFACMHDQNSEIGEVLYRILKLNVVNLLKNPSPYAIDLSDAILNVIPQHHEN